MGFVTPLVLNWEFYFVGDIGDEILLIVVTGRQGFIVPVSRV